jgi:hypothetical protein
MLKIGHPKDFWAGVLYVTFGLSAIIIAANYPMGNAARMGPGWFPRALGILLILLGSALALRALKLKGTPIDPWHWRPTATVLISVVIFGMIVPRVGVALSTIFLIVAASSASKEFKPREALISGVVLAALSVGVFVIGLNMQLPIWPVFN